jgi:UDP-N-acetylmuramoyl-L-alanyl-D-glutamate--2,6-diaminopimelate ligase
MSASAAPIRLRTLLAGFAEVPAALDRPIAGLSCDSPAVGKGELFLALRGQHHHGLAFYPSVRAAGAAAVAWEPPYTGAIEAAASCPLIEVPDLRAKLGAIADRCYGDPSRQLELVGITGTEGKTSCAYFIAQCLHSAQQPCGLLGTLGYGLYGELASSALTTPDAVTLRRWLAAAHARGVRFAAMEVSSHALAQGRVAGLRFAVAVLTNLARDHLDYHGDLASYGAAKRLLFTEQPLRHKVLNGDDAFGRQLLQELPGPAVAYGWQRPLPDSGAFVWGERLEARASAGGLALRVRSSWGEGEIQSRLLGGFNASNLLATLATLLVLELPLNDALARVAQVSNAPGRMERLGGERGQPLVVVDYAHKPNALEQVLRTLREHTAGTLWCVFGCGGERDAGKRPLMGAVAERWADRIIITNDNPRGEDPAAIAREILAGLREPACVQLELDRAQAIAQAIASAGSGDVVLIAGKGHEDYQLLGERRIAFSDRAVAQRCLEQAG